MAQGAQKTLQRVLDCYRVYIHHLTTVCQDISIKSDDRACLKGYLWQWQHARILVGCAMFIDAMNSTSLLSLTLSTDISIVHRTNFEGFQILKQFVSKRPSIIPKHKAR